MTETEKVQDVETGEPQDYMNFKLPREFVHLYVDSLIRIRSLGFSSRADVVKSAIREFWEQKIEKIKEASKNAKTKSQPSNT